MAASHKQLAANKKNAQKSTGPVTAIGKAKVSVNAISHGVLSSKLILPGESEEEYQQLYDDLVSSLNPVGTLEFNVVEKIAINLWKTKRLNHAESAEISINLQPRKIAKSITSIMGRSNIPVMAFELTLTDAEHEKWFEEILEEFEGLELPDYCDLADLSDTVLINDLVSRIADVSGRTAASFLKNFQFDGKGLTENLLNRCFEIDYRRAEILQLKELVKIKNTILGGESEKKFTRYQTTLNNEFYRLVNTLRDLKKMQSHFIEGEVTTVIEDKK